jgi:hypothetical protein
MACHNPARTLLSTHADEGKAAAEWLQSLAEQQELLQQREVFKDINRKR